MKRLKKQILNSAFFRLLLSYVVALYIRLVLVTSRKIYFIPEESKAFYTGEMQCIGAFWHGRLLLTQHLVPKARKRHALISAHRDGLIISETMRRFNIDTVVGSSTKGSLSALKNIYTLLKQGHNIAITPDGPKGPFQIAAVGIAHIAARTGMHVIPITFSATRYKRMRSWDRFMVALPFSTLYFAVGLPITSDAGAGKEDIESLRMRIESSLTAITEDVDRRAGVI